MTFRTAAHEAIAKAFHAPPMLGYIPDSDDRRKRQKSSVWLFGSSPSAPAQASLGKYRGPIFNQGQTGSCVGHGTTQAAQTTANANGAPFGFIPSPRRVYQLARVLERSTNTTPLTDGGAMPTDTITVLSNWGLAPIGPMAPDGRFSDVWGPDDSNNGQAPNVNSEPTLDELQQSGLCLASGEYRIDETGPNVTAQMTAALSAGQPAALIIGVFVDTGFMSWNPSTGPIRSINLSDPSGGGHCLSCDYFYTLPDGTLVFGGPNSWDVSWPGGSNPGSPFWSPGCWEMTAACLQSVLSDALVMNVRRIGS